MLTDHQFLETERSMMQTDLQKVPGHRPGAYVIVSDKIAPHENSGW